MVIRGFSREMVCLQSFEQMNYFIAQRLRQWLWRKHGNPSGKYERWPDRELFAAYGLYHLPTTGVKPCKR